MSKYSQGSPCKLCGCVTFYSSSGRCLGSPGGVRCKGRRHVKHDLFNDTESIREFNGYQWFWYSTKVISERSERNKKVRHSYTGNSLGGGCEC